MDAYLWLLFRSFRWFFRLLHLFANYWRRRLFFGGDRTQTTIRTEQSNQYGQSWTRARGMGHGVRFGSSVEDQELDMYVRMYLSEAAFFQRTVATESRLLTKDRSEGSRARAKVTSGTKRLTGTCDSSTLNFRDKSHFCGINGHNFLYGGPERLRASTACNVRFVIHNDASVLEQVASLRTQMMSNQGGIALLLFVDRWWQLSRPRSYA